MFESFMRPSGQRRTIADLIMEKLAEHEQRSERARGEDGTGRGAAADAQIDPKVRKVFTG